MDSYDKAFHEMLDAIVQHPSSKQATPTTVRELQLEAEIRFLRAEISRALAVIQTALDRLDARTDMTVLDDEGQVF